MKSLKSKYGLDETTTLPSDPELMRLYNEEREQWISDNCERKYTPEYYKLFSNLSPQTNAARDVIQFKIKSILDKVRDDNGTLHLNDLKDSEYLNLLDLYNQKRALASEYYTNGEKKVDIDLKIAQELK